MADAGVQGMGLTYLWSMARARARQDRRGRRTFVAVAIATYGLLLCFATINAMGNVMTSSARDVISGDVSVFAEGSEFSMLNPASSTVRLLPDGEAVADAAASVEGVEGVRQRVNAPASLVSPDQQTGALVMGVDLEAEGYTLLEGELPADGEICLTQSQVEELGIGVGDDLTLLLAGAAEQNASVTVPVACVYDTTRFGLFRTSQALMRAEDVQELLDRPGAVTQVLVDVEDPGDVDDVVPLLEEALADEDVQIERASTTADLIYSIRAAQQAVMWALVLVTAAICAVLVANIVRFALMREKSEFATMRAMGFSPRDLRVLSMLQTLRTGLLMVGAGTMAGLVSTWVCGWIGIPLGGAAELFGDTTMHPSLTMVQVVLTMAVMLGSLVLANLLASHALLRRSPLEMLRAR